MANNTFQSFSSLVNLALGVMSDSAAQKKDYIIHIKRWYEIGDEKTRTHTVGVYYVDDEQRLLIVYVDSSVWVQEFTMNKHIYLARAEMIYGTSWIKDIIFKINKRTPVQQPLLKLKQNTQEYKPIELTKSEEQMLYDMTTSFEDSPLKYQLQKALFSSYKYNKSKNK